MFWRLDEDKPQGGANYGHDPQRPHDKHWRQTCARAQATQIRNRPQPRLLHPTGARLRGDLYHLGFHVPRHPLRGRDHSTAGHRRHPALHRWHNSSRVGPRAHWLSGLVVGALFFLIGHGTLHWAEQYVGSGLAALLLATEPMFILVLAWSMGQQKISRLSALGLGLGVLGVATLTGVELTVKGSSLLALMAVLVGSLAWSAGVVISPKLKLPSDALGRTALPTICGAVMLLAAAALTGEFHATHWASISSKSILGLAYLIVFGSVVAFTAYTWLLQRCPPALVATHTYANPVVAVFLGWLLASEPLTMRVVLASVAILGAIILIRRGEQTAVQSASVPVSAPARSVEKCA